MDATRLDPPRRLSVPIANRWGDGEMAVLDFGDPKRQVDMVFLHANGFNALTYRSLLAPLSGTLRILAPDLRGHGASRLPTREAGRFDWFDHRDDVAALLDTLDGPPVVLAGHSMGATSALLAAGERAKAVSSLVLLDPVIWPRSMAAVLGLPLIRHLPYRAAIAVNARKRRDRFDSREAALAAYRGRGAFKGWPDRVLADYLADGVAVGPDGAVLTCTPAWEASNYAAQGHDPWRVLKRLKAPVRVLKGETGSTCSLKPGQFDHVAVETVAGGTHFFPMLAPEVARDALFDACV